MSRVNDTTSHRLRRILTLIPILLILPWQAGCGALSLGATDGTAVFTPSFVRVVVEELGPTRLATNGSVASITLIIQGCVNPADNQSITIALTEDEILLNLHEGNQGCSTLFQSFDYGVGSATETFLPQTGTTPAGNLDHALAVYLGETTGQAMIVTTEKTLRSPLQHNEVLAFSVMPRSGTNNIPVYTSMNETPTASAGTQKLLVSHLADDGDLGDGDQGLVILLSCETIRQFNMCDGTTLLNYRFRLLADPNPEQAIDEASLPGLISGATGTIQPLSDSIFANGFRFDMIVPKQEDGSLETDLMFISKYGTTYRYFRFSVADLFL